MWRGRTTRDRRVFLRYSACVRAPHPDSNRIIQLFFDKYGPSTRYAFQAVSAKGNWEEAQSILGDELGEDSLTRTEFIKFSKEHRSRFPESAKVIDWLESLE